MDAVAGPHPARSRLGFGGLLRRCHTSNHRRQHRQSPPHHSASPLDLARRHRSGRFVQPRAIPPLLEHGMKTKPRRRRPCCRGFDGARSAEKGGGSSAARRHLGVPKGREQSKSASLLCTLVRMSKIPLISKNDTSFDERVVVLIRESRQG